MTRGQLLQVKVFEIGQLIDRKADIFLEIRRLMLEEQKVKELIKENLTEILIKTQVSEDG